MFKATGIVKIPFISKFLSSHSAVSIDLPGRVNKEV